MYPDPPHCPNLGLQFPGVGVGFVDVEVEVEVDMEVDVDIDVEELVPVGVGMGPVTAGMFVAQGYAEVVADHGDRLL